MKRAYADIPEGQVHYRTEGTGEPLLLLHQTPTSSDEYCYMIPVLAKSYRVIAMDTMGFGESDKPPHLYTIPEYARSVVSFLDALGIKKTNVLGHHTGACIGVELAAEYPQRVDKLVLSGCPMITQEEVLAFLNSEGMQAMVLKADGSHMVKRWNMFKSFGGDSRPNVEVLHAYTLEYLKAGVRAEEAHWSAIKYDTRPKFPRIKSPTLVLSGEKDMFLHNVEDIKRLIPRSKTAVIPGGTAFLRRPKWSRDFAKAALAFLKDPGV